MKQVSLLPMDDNNVTSTIADDNGDFKIIGLKEVKI